MLTLRMLTILNDNIIGPGVIYAYPKDGEVSATLSDRAMKLENLVVSKSDQVWSFEGIAVKFGKGKGLQRCKVGICPFCIKNPTLEREAEIEKIPEKDTEESLIRDRMKLGIRVKDIVYNLEIASEYYIKFIDPAKKLKFFIDLYTSLWGSAGEAYLKYREIPEELSERNKECIISIMSRMIRK